MFKAEIIRTYVESDKNILVLLLFQIFILLVIISSTFLSFRYADKYSLTLTREVSKKKILKNNGILFAIFGLLTIFTAYFFILSKNTERHDIQFVSEDYIAKKINTINGQTSFQLENNNQEIIDNHIGDEMNFSAEIADDIKKGDKVKIIAGPIKQNKEEWKRKAKAQYSLKDIEDISTYTELKIKKTK